MVNEWINDKWIEWIEWIEELKEETNKLLNETAQNEINKSTHREKNENWYSVKKYIFQNIKFFTES